MKITKIKHIFLSLALILSTVVGGLTFAGQQTYAQEDEKTYVIATDATFAPFSYVDLDGGLTGIDIDVFKAAMDSEGISYEFMPMSFSAALQALETNQVDGMIAGMAITEERQKIFDFSEPYYISGNSYAVLPDSGIESYEDLAGGKVAVKTGTTGHAIAESMADEYGFEITIFEDSANMYEDVMVGNSDAAIEVFAVMAHAINTGQVDLSFIGEELSPSQMGFAVNKGRNPELLSSFNNGLQTIQANGTYDELLETYLGEDAQKEKDDEGFFSQLKQNSPALMSGLWTTTWISLVTIVIATVLGVLIGLMRVAHNKVLKGIAIIYIDLMRGVPMIVFVFFVYFGVAQWFGINFTPEVAGVLALSVNTAAYIAEIVRGGIQAVDSGQTEASRSLGLNYSQTMTKIIMPQAIRIMTPSFINQFIMTLKNTSILSVIGLVELTQSGRIIISRTYQSGSMWLIIGLMYIVIITILTYISNFVDRRLNSGY